MARPSAQTQTQTQNGGAGRTGRRVGGVGLAVALCGLTLGCPAQFPSESAAVTSFHAYPLYCDQNFRTRPFEYWCVPDVKYDLHVWIDYQLSDPESDLSPQFFWHDERGLSVAVEPIAVLKGALFRLPVKPVGRDVTITASTSPWQVFSAPSQTIHFISAQTPAWLQKADAIRQQNGGPGGERAALDYLKEKEPAQAISELEKTYISAKKAGFSEAISRHPSETFQKLRHYAAYKSLLGRSEKTLGSPQAGTLLAEAIEANLTIGERAGALEDLLWRADWLELQMGQVQQAAQELKNHEKMFDDVPQKQPWRLRQHARVLAQLQDLPGALAKYDEARYWASILRPTPDALADIASVQAALLSSIGQVHKAMAVLLEVEHLRIERLQIERQRAGGAAQGPPDGGGATQGPPDGGGAAQGPPDGGGATQGPPDGGGAAQGPTDGGGQASDPLACRRIELALTWVILRHHLHEAEPHRPLPVGFPDVDATLRETEPLLKSCDQPERRKAILVNRALLALIRQDYDGAGAALKRAATVNNTAMAPDIEAMCRYVAGHLALQRGKFARAREEFKELSKGPKDDSGTLEREPWLLDGVWHGVVGLARVAAKIEPDPSTGATADELYAQADEIARIGQLLLPLAYGRSGYLSRYVLGPALHIDSLWRQGKFQEAMEVLRRTRRWATSDMAALRASNQHAGKEAPDGPSGYQKQARELARALYTWRWASTENRHAAWMALLAQQREADRALRAEIRAAAPDANQDALRTLAGDEVLLACHPGPDKQYLCLAQRGDGGPETARFHRFDVPASEVLGDPRAPDPKPAWAARWLGELLPLLRGARRIWILGDGSLRHIDFRELPIGSTGQTLEAAFEVYDTLDLPPLGAGRPGAAAAGATGLPTGAPTAAPTPAPTATAKAAASVHVVVAGQQGHDPLRRRAPAIAQVAKGLGTVTQTAESTGRTTSAEIKDREEKTLVGLLQQAGGAVLVGHIDRPQAEHRFSRQRVTEGDETSPSMPIGSSGLQLDIPLVLGLKPGPAWALVVGCGSGDSGEEWGTVRGLGLAQAFVIRGAGWVLGTSRTIEDSVAPWITEIMLQELAKGRAAGAPLDPVRALRATKQRLRTGDVPGLSAKEREKLPLADVSALRLFTP